MHIPDGFLNTPTLVTTQILAIGSLAVAVRKVNKHLEPQRVPLMGLCTAFLFVSQLFSFPIPGGTSVHISGVVLISVLLGPYSGVIICALALAVQAFVLQHGGAWSFGANLINMGLIPCFLGYPLFCVLKKRHTLAALGLTAFFMKVLGAAACSVELAISGLVPLKTSLWAMILGNSLGGLLEAFISISIYSVLKSTRPELLALEKI